MVHYPIIVVSQVVRSTASPLCLLLNFVVYGVASVGLVCDTLQRPATSLTYLFFREAVQNLFEFKFQ